MPLQKCAFSPYKALESHPEHPSVKSQGEVYENWLTGELICGNSDQQLSWKCNRDFSIIHAFSYFLYI